MFLFYFFIFLFFVKTRFFHEKIETLKKIFFKKSVQMDPALFSSFFLRPTFIERLCNSLPNYFNK
jgi:hypothetical protein